MIRSFLSTVVGWVAAIVALPIAGFLNAGTVTSLSWDLILGSAYWGALFVFPVLFCLLWPLYRLVPIRSPLWRPSIGIPCGAVAGGLLLWMVIPALIEFPIHPYFYVGPFVGAVTCAVGCALKHRESHVF